MFPKFFCHIFLNVDGTGKVNKKGVAYYNRLIDYMLKRGRQFELMNWDSSKYLIEEAILTENFLDNLKNDILGSSFTSFFCNTLLELCISIGITPYANLNHYDLPQALQERYLGWLSHKVV